MTRDDIIRMAEETGLAFASEEFPDIWQIYMNPGREEIEHFAALVAQHEREACADVCEGHYDTAQAADAIRARGNA
jgi:hypothetical protein